MRNVLERYNLQIEKMKIYDIHSHILPSVDDGPSDFSETIQIVNSCEDQGISYIVATPHRKDVSDSRLLPHIKKSVSDINNYLEISDLEIRVLLGMENHLDHDLMDGISDGSALTINGGKYVLVEMPYTESLGVFQKPFDALIESEYIPVIAHPERMGMFLSNPNLLWEITSKNVILQITAGSLYGRFGSEVECFTKSIIDSNRSVVMASDTHMYKGARAQDLMTGFEHAVSLVGQIRAEEMVSDLPLRILNNY